MSITFGARTVDTRVIARKLLNITIGRAMVVNGVYVLRVACDGWDVGRVGEETDLDVSVRRVLCSMEEYELAGW